ncbi:MAG: DNRLRE domain-containing protein, partial [Clostridiales bacterium]
MMKKNKKIIALIVLFAFFLQTGPVYAMEVVLSQNQEGYSSETNINNSEEQYTDNNLSMMNETPIISDENVVPLDFSTSDLPVSEESAIPPPDDIMADTTLPENTEVENTPVYQDTTFFSQMPNDRESDQVIEGELNELRESNVKYFLNTDKTITASTYPYDIHYKNANGEFADINNTLMVNSDSEIGDILENTDNSFKIKFSKKAHDKNMVKLEKDGHKISWGFIDANKTKSLTQKIKNFNMEVSSDPQVLEKTESSVVYSEIKTNVDLEYDIIGPNIKENIILKNKETPNSYQFVFNTKELVAVRDKNEILFNAPDGNTVFRMLPLVMIDSVLEASGDIEVTLETIKDNKNNHQYLLTVTPNRAWLDAPERVYPIEIDPSIATTQSPGVVMDTYISSDNPNYSDYYSWGWLKVGTNGSTVNRSMMAFNLPGDIKGSDRIVNAKLGLYPYLGANSNLFNELESSKAAPIIEAHEITTFWNDTTVSWNNPPSIDEKILDYDIIKAKDGQTANRWYTWDITQLVDKWYMEGHSYGVMFKYSNNYSQSMAVASFISANGSPIGASPLMNITYLNMIGLEDYWTYHSQDAGIAGKGYVNDFTGALTSITNDVSLDSEKIPMSIDHIFSSYNAGISQTSLDVGKGFMLSIQERITYKNVGGKDNYVYTDGDGTQHYFTMGSDGVWRDDSGLEYTLYVGSPECIITDKKDNKRFFDSNTQSLIRIQDNHGNIIYINHDINNRIIDMNDESGRTISFKCDDGNFPNRLTRIILPDGQQINYGYISRQWYPNATDAQVGCLDRITFPGTSEVNTVTAGSPNYAWFRYSPDGCLNEMIDGPKNMKVTYEISWNNNMRRVNSYSIQNTDNVVSNKYLIDYKNYLTKYTEDTPKIDGKSRYEIYSFNTKGQTISAVDQDGNAIFTSMGIAGGAKNKVTFASKTQRTITNLLKNHDFENGTAYYDTTSQKAQSDAISSDTDYAFIGNNKLKIFKSNTNSINTAASQTVSVPGGACYTFSAHIKTGSFSTASGSSSGGTSGRYGGAFLKLEGGNKTQIKDKIVNTTGYIRHEVTIDLTNTSGTISLKASCGINGEAGTVYFDSLQLEKSECANRYNLIEDGDFETESNSIWVPTNIGGSNPPGINDGWVGSVVHSGNTAYQLYGNPKLAKKICNTIPVQGKNGEGIVYGVWIKSNGVPNKDVYDDGTKSSVGITVELTNGSQSSYSSQTITPTSNEWIYIAGNAIANFDYSSIKVYLKCNYNANYVYFDDVGIYKDSFGESFNYDAKGNVVSAVDMANNTESVIANGNNDITSYKDGNNNNYNFTYDGGNTGIKKHDLTNTTAPDNSFTNMAYESWGALKYASIYPSGGGNLAIRTQNNYNSTGNYLAEAIDQRGISTYFYYNNANGLLNDMSNPGSSTVYTHYTYDGNTNKFTSISLTGVPNTVSYGYSKESINKIAVSSGENAILYTLNHDGLGNLTSIYPGNGDMSKETYSYIPGRNLQSSVTYGNNQYVNYQYDNQDRLIAAKVNNTPISRFIYNDNGLLGKSFYYSEGTPVETTYQYDFADRFVSSFNSKGFGTYNIKYDKNNNNTAYNSYIIKNNENGTEAELDYPTTYEYNNINEPTHTRAAINSDFENFYDTFGRNNIDHYYTTGANYNAGVWTSRAYLNINDSKTTNMVSNYAVRFSSNSDSGQNPDYKYIHTYDNNGNITTLGTQTKSGSQENTTYSYDNLNQLVGVRYASGANHDYSYDAKGNITQRCNYNVRDDLVGTSTYTYNNNSLNTLGNYSSGSLNKSYIYDNVGNPTSITSTGSQFGTLQLTWEQGKQLKNISDITKINNTYCYNESGEISKVTKKDGSTIEYYYDDGQLEFEEYRNSTGNLTKIHKYFYDSHGDVRFLLTKTDQFTNSNAYNLYAYVYNSIGEISDLVKLRAQNGSSTGVVNILAAHYEYDDYGRVSISNYADNMGTLNPIRYKGYYYDNDLNWYHLQSRFYDPAIGRFISPDDLSLLTESQGSLTDKNLYSYCDNNPIMRKDTDGEFWHILVGAGVGA